MSSEGEVTCSTPAVANSASSGGDVPVRRVGDTVNFTCSEGFQLDGAQQITCGPGGQWQPEPPQCRPSPEGELVYLLHSWYDELSVHFKELVSLDDLQQVDAACRPLSATPTPTSLTGTSRWHLLLLAKESITCVTLDTFKQAAASIAGVLRESGRRCC